METTAKRASRAACQAAARRRWGKRVVVREHANAMSPAAREAHHAKQKSKRQELDALDARAKAIGGGHWIKLLEAAEFFLAVNGDEPSGTLFKEAVAASRAAEDMNAERQAARANWESGRGIGLRKRWEVYSVQTVGNLAAFGHVHCEADTLDELLEKINAMA